MSLDANQFHTANERESVKVANDLQWQYQLGHSKNKRASVSIGIWTHSPIPLFNVYLLGIIELSAPKLCHVFGAPWC